jgi:hypothetical protein
MFRKILVAFLSLLAMCISCAESVKLELAIQLGVQPVSKDIIKSVMACMRLNICAADTKTTEDKEYLVMGIPGDRATSVEIIFNKKEQFFVEITGSGFKILIIDNDRTGVADEVRVSTDDTVLVSRHPFGSVGWARAQTDYNDVMDVAFIYSLILRK